jgi:hypothetical protein
VKAVSQRCPFVQPIHPLHQLLPILAACEPATVAPKDLPTQPLRRVLCALVACLPNGPSSPLSGAHSRFVVAGAATAAPAAASTTVGGTIGAVEVQRGTGLTDQQVDRLIGQAKQIIGCVQSE